MTAPLARVGISGWNYKGWRKQFYPKSLPANKELAFASRHVNSIEINGTFYSLQRPSSFQKWHDETPTDFVFSVKGPKFITHIKRLRDCQIPLANFFASGVFALKNKLGPILWQLPPLFLYRPEIFEEFFKSLPRTTDEAAQLSKLTNGKVKEEPLTEASVDIPLRYCIEVRHSSFENPEFVEQLRRHNIALVFADTAGLWPYMEELTSDFVYLRLHGDEHLYRSSYSKDSLKWWSRRLKIWQKGEQPKDAYSIMESYPRLPKRDAFVYFDNTDKLHAPYDAKLLSQMLNSSRSGNSPSRSR
jgi:uncharacterized protein YecE (DUF72 family)